MRTKRVSYVIFVIVIKKLFLRFTSHIACPHRRDLQINLEEEYSCIVPTEYKDRIEDLGERVKSIEEKVDSLEHRIKKLELKRSMGP